MIKDQKRGNKRQYKISTLPCAQTCIPKPHLTPNSCKARIWQMHCSGSTPEQIAKTLTLNEFHVRTLIGRMR
jgi:hypothetical protein